MTPELAFGLVLRALREEHGLTQEALGRLSGYHPTYISQLERGVQSPSLGTLYRLARILQVSPSTFLARSEGQVDELPERPPQNRPRKTQ